MEHISHHNSLINLAINKGLLPTGREAKKLSTINSPDESKNQTVTQIEEYVKLIRELHFNVNNSAKEIGNQNLNSDSKIKM